ncbi:hypothetical protein GIB67_020462 [Kingdonia uniflora]|uniref:Uncharacterized protein n=1 Tax=Kingdonia uniflora TaxID=39325 RepID=A0A7J7LUY9_9MAGN|nr:hypothetical protein GIB67_020462 [Kingdonia uniflora]
MYSPSSIFSKFHWCLFMCFMASLVYLCVMFLLIVLLFCFTIFAFVVTNKGAGEVVSERGYKEYNFGDYSNWLQKRVNGNKNWRKINSCLMDSKVCKSHVDGGDEDMKKSC